MSSIKQQQQRRKEKEEEGRELVENGQHEHYQQQHEAIRQRRTTLSSTNIDSGKISSLNDLEGTFMSLQKKHRRSTMGGTSKREGTTGIIMPSKSTEKGVTTTAASATASAAVGNKITLGSDAASSYYFSETPMTPSVTKRMSRNRKRTRAAVNSARKESRDFENIDPNLPGSYDIAKVLEEDEDTEETKSKKKEIGKLSSGEKEANTMDLLLGINASDDTTTSLLFTPPATTINSINSIATDDTSIGLNLDDLNRSILSDTTELTASNFVFAASARGKLRDAEAERREKERVEEHERREREERERIEEQRRERERKQKEEAEAEQLRKNKEIEKRMREMEEMVQREKARAAILQEELRIRDENERINRERIEEEKRQKKEQEEVANALRERQKQVELEKIEKEKREKHERIEKERVEEEIRRKSDQKEKEANALQAKEMKEKVERERIEVERSKLEKIEKGKKEEQNRINKERAEEEGRRQKEEEERRKREEEEKEANVVREKQKLKERSDKIEIKKIEKEKKEEQERIEMERVEEEGRRIKEQDDKEANTLREKQKLEKKRETIENERIEEKVEEDKRRSQKQQKEKVKEKCHQEIVEEQVRYQKGNAKKEKEQIKRSKELCEYTKGSEDEMKNKRVEEVEEEKGYIKELKKATIEREIVDTNVFREKMMLKKEKEMVLDNELMDENRIEREEIEEGGIVKDSNKEDNDINIYKKDVKSGLGNDDDEFGMSEDETANLADLDNLLGTNSSRISAGRDGNDVDSSISEYEGINAVEDGFDIYGCSSEDEDSKEENMMINGSSRGLDDTINTTELLGCNVDKPPREKVQRGGHLRLNKVEALIIGDITKVERGVRSTEKMIVVDTVNCSKKRVHDDGAQHSSHNSSTFASFASLSSSNSSTPIKFASRDNSPYQQQTHRAIVESSSSKAKFSFRDETSSMRKLTRSLKKYNAKSRSTGRFGAGWGRQQYLSKNPDHFIVDVDPLKQLSPRQSLSLLPLRANTSMIDDEFQQNHRKLKNSIDFNEVKEINTNVDHNNEGCSIVEGGVKNKSEMNGKVGMSHDADQSNNRSYSPPTTSHRGESGSIIGQYEVENRNNTSTIENERGGIGLNNATGIGRVQAIHENEYKSSLGLNLRAFIKSPQRKSGTLSPLLPPKSSSKSPAESTFRRRFMQRTNQLPDESTNFFDVDISIDGCTDGNENSNYGNEEISSRNKESRKMTIVSNEETVLMAHSDIADLEDNPLAKGRNGNITTEKDGNSFVSSSIGNNEMKYPVKNTLSATNGKGTKMKPGKAPESQNHFKLYANSPAKNTRLAQSRRILERNDPEYTFKPNALPVSPGQGKRLSIERELPLKEINQVDSHDKVEMLLDFSEQSHLIRPRNLCEDTNLTLSDKKSKTGAVITSPSERDVKLISYPMLHSPAKKVQAIKRKGNLELSNIVNNRMAESPARNTRSSVKKRRNMKQDRSDKFFKSDMLESSKLGICLSEEKRKSLESNIQSKTSTILEVSSNVSRTSQISTDPKNGPSLTTNSTQNKKSKPESIKLQNKTITKSKILPDQGEQIGSPILDALLSPKKQSSIVSGNSLELSPINTRSSSIKRKSTLSDQTSGISHDKVGPLSNIIARSLEKGVNFNGSEATLSKSPGQSFICFPNIKDSINSSCTKESSPSMTSPTKEEKRLFQSAKKKVVIKPKASFDSLLLKNMTVESHDKYSSSTHSPIKERVLMEENNGSISPKKCSSSVITKTDTFDSNVETESSVMRRENLKFPGKFNTAISPNKIASSTKKKLSDLCCQTNNSCDSIVNTEFPRAQTFLGHVSKELLSSSDNCNQDHLNSPYKLKKSDVNYNVPEDDDDTEIVVKYLTSNQPQITSSIPMENNPIKEKSPCYWSDINSQVPKDDCMTASFLTSDSSINSSSRKNSFALSDVNYSGSLESITKLIVSSSIGKSDVQLENNSDPESDTFKVSEKRNDNDTKSHLESKSKDNRACSDIFVGNSCSPVTVSLNDSSSVNLGSILDSVSQTEANTSNAILLNQNSTETFPSLSISAPSNDFDQSKNDRFDASTTESQLSLKDLEKKSFSSIDVSIDDSSNFELSSRLSSVSNKDVITSTTYETKSDSHISLKNLKKNLSSHSFASTDDSSSGLNLGSLLDSVSTVEDHSSGISCMSSVAHEVQSIKRTFDGNEVDSPKVIGKIVSLSSSNEGGLKEKKIEDILNSSGNSTTSSFEKELVLDKQGGNDRSTADTLVLQDIMKDLNDEVSKKKKEMSQAKYELKICESPSSTISTDSEEDKATADTEDLKVLLSLKEDLVTTESFSTRLNKRPDNLKTIQENIEEHVHLKKDIRIECSKNSWKSSMPSTLSQNASPELTHASIKSVGTPKSILNSSRKRKDFVSLSQDNNKKKSVVFGSPIAAEYNIDSPSANLTPMTSKRTKKLYTVPKNNFNTESINALDISFSEPNKNAIHLATTTNTSMKKGEQSTKDHEIHQRKISRTFPRDLTSTSLSGESDAETMDLENNIEGLIENTWIQSDSHISNSSPYCKDNLNYRKQTDLGDTSVLDKSDGQTMELEKDMGIFLGSVGLRNSIQNDSALSSFTSPSHIYTATEGVTIELENDVRGVMQIGQESDSTLNNEDFSFSGESSSNSISMVDAKSITNIHSQEGCVSNTFSPVDHVKNKRLDFISTPIETSPQDLESMDLEETMDLDIRKDSSIDSEIENPSPGTKQKYESESNIYSATKLNLSPNAIDSVYELIEQKEKSNTNLTKDDGVTLSTMEQIESDREMSMTDELTKTLELEANINEIVGSWDENTLNTNSFPNAKVKSKIRRKSQKICSPYVPISTNGDLDISFSSSATDEVYEKSEEYNTSDILDGETQDNISTIGWKELSNIAELLPEKKELLRYSTDNIERELSSLLVDCSDYYVVTKDLHLFFNDVCKVMEKNAKLNHICPETEFVSVLDKELRKKLFVKVNEAFDTKCNPKEQIKILAEKTRTCQIHDFKSWETEVLSTINELLRSTKNGAQEETDVIMKNMDNIESKMEMAIEHQIRDLEIQIEEEMKTVEQKKNNFRHLNYTLQKYDEMQSELQKSKEIAESTFLNLKPLERLHNWALLSFTDVKVTVFYKDILRGDGIIVEFKETSSDSLSCNGHVSNNQLLHSKLKIPSKSKYSSSLTSFYHFKLTHLCSQIKTMSSPNICNITHHIQWSLGRLNSLVEELTLLESQYEGIALHWSEGKIQFKFEKISPLGTKIICSFEIHDLYPFGLLDIKLASNVDIQSLERQLIRKTKPGFGYISRICDMMKILCNSSKF